MNKLKKKSLYLALVAGLGAVSVGGTASAVNVGQNGLGEVLIFPYYTVRNNTVTAFSVTNTTDYPKAVKVRFTEGKNSREVLDFNLYLSKHDMWTGAIVATADGAKLVTTDKSCTYPAINPTNGQAFVNYAYSGAVVEGIHDSGGDGETQSLDRTREGYFEIIEMGEITHTAVINAVTHVSGVPKDCSFVQQPVTTMDMGPRGNYPLDVPLGGLAGTGTLINVASGMDFTFDPVVLDNFSARNIWAAAETIKPDMKSATPISSVVYGNAMIESDWTSASENADAVSAVLMHDNVINDYVLDSATKSGTDWVVTMPTKRYYVPVDNPASSTVWYADMPFTDTFWLNGACEEVAVDYWDREERFVRNVSFSPPPPSQVNALCWESTVVTFNNSDVLGSTNGVNIPISNFENGWARISFNNVLNRLINVGGTTVDPFGPGTVYTAATATYYGLPAVGFMVQSFTNGDVGGLLSNYGGNFGHKHETLISGNWGN